MPGGYKKTGEPVDIKAYVPGGYRTFCVCQVDTKACAMKESEKDDVECSAYTLTKERE